MPAQHRLLALVLGVVLTAGCSVSRDIKYEAVDLVRTDRELPAAELMSVGIVVFDPGIGEQVDEKKMIFPDVRKAEARYMPYHLKTTLEASGQWGSVWVLPEKSENVDVLVWGRIDKSDGLEVNVRIGAWDATGREWLNDTYSVRVAEKAYSRYRDRTQDPYQVIFNRIANDLLEKRRSLSERDRALIAQVSELRFAGDLAPAVFGEYVEKGGGKARGEQYAIRRLPAEGDPLFERVRAVREREYAVVDTINEYYAGLYFNLAMPYEDWRRVSREETIKYQDLKRSAMLRYLLGGAAILGSVLYGAQGDNTGITIAGIMLGAEGIKSGLGKSAEASIAREGLKEQGKSLGSEAEPLVVEVEGQTRRLVGTAEEKFREWRRLLKEIYEKETGLPQSIAPANPPTVAAPG